MHILIPFNLLKREEEADCTVINTRNTCSVTVQEDSKRVQPVLQPHTHQPP